MLESKNEKKEKLRAKVQDLITCYEQEKRRNEELQMELERLKAEQLTTQLDDLQPQRAPAQPLPEAPPQFMHTGRLPQQPYAATQQRPQPCEAYPYGQQQNQYGMPQPLQYYGQPPQAGAGNLMISIGQAQQAITQVCMKLQQANSYGVYPQQFDQDNIRLLSLLNTLYCQLNDLSRELAMRQCGAAPFAGN